MPGRAQALMRTRCPACSTVFRVTSEQLRLKAGKVRCGQCQTVFNAFDQFESAAQTTQDETTRLVAPPPSFSETSASALPTAEVTEISAVTPEAVPETSAPPVFPPTSLPPSTEGQTQTIAEPEPEPEPEVTSAASGDVAAEYIESPEESTQAAREAGLVAARELNDTPAYNRWAAGTLASDGLNAFANEPARRTSWPFVLVSILLALVLLGQLAIHYRSELVQHLPDAAKLFELIEIDIPLPRNPDLVAIETSDLQSDNTRGMFVLNATLRNRALYAQDWPALELTLTDTSDAVVARRVMFAADYLPPTTPADIFPANGETAIRLWVEAKNIGAAGYRLYIFYP